MTLATPQEALAHFFEDLASCRNKTDLTHGLHPYPAKFIPHIPRELISAYGVAGLPVLDPMCGSGTTLVEAAVQGFRSYGLDLNPIAVLAAQAKTLRLTEAVETELHGLANQLMADSANPQCVAAELPDFLNRRKWFADVAVAELVHALNVMARSSSESQLLAKAAISAVTVAVSNQESETRWCAKPREVAAGDVLARVAQKIRSVARASRAYTAGSPEPASVVRGDARALPYRDESVGLIVTSPPYANSHDYYLYNKLRMFLLGYDVSSVQAAEIGSRNRHSDYKEPVSAYLTAMRGALAEWRRVLVSGGRVAVVVADAVVRGEFFDMGVEFLRLGEAVGLLPESHFRFAHRGFNSAFQRGFGTQFEKQTHVLVLS